LVETTHVDPTTAAAVAAGARLSAQPDERELSDALELATREAKGHNFLARYREQVEAERARQAQSSTDELDRRLNARTAF
jgi:hypothetical protein